MKNVNIKFSFKGLGAKAKENISIILLAALIILILMEAWTVKSAFGVFSDSQNDQPIVSPKLVRVNLTAYNAILKRIKDASSYKPQPFVSKSPFGLNDKSANSNSASSTSTKANSNSDE